MHTELQLEAEWTIRHERKIYGEECNVKMDIKQDVIKWAGFTLIKRGPNSGLQ
jgi:hypothetical protein